MAVRLLKDSVDRMRNGLRITRMDQRHHAAAETTAGQTSPEHARSVLRSIHDRIQLFAGVLEVIDRAIVAGKHQFSESSEIAIVQQLPAFEHTLAFTDRVRGTLGSQWRHLRLVSLPFSPAHITQSRNGMLQHLLEVCSRFLAMLTPLVILPIHQGMFGLRIAHQEGRVIPHRVRLDFQRTEVRHNERVLLAEEAGDLVEQAALHTGVLMLGLLANLRHVECVDLDSIQLAQGQSRAHFQGG